MEKVVVNYVQKLYAGIIFNDIVEEEIEKRSPMLVENDGIMQGFRFYDVEYMMDNDKMCDTNVTNYSNWIYYGTRYSLEEIISKYGNNPKFKSLIRNMRDSKCKFACLTQAGKYQPLQIGDMTYNEYLERSNYKVKKLEYGSTKHR